MSRMTGLGLWEAMRACESADELDDPRVLFEERRRSHRKEGEGMQAGRARQYKEAKPQREVWRLLRGCVA